MSPVFRRHCTPARPRRGSSMNGRAVIVARLLLLLPMAAALLRPRPASRCIPTHLAQRTRHLFAQLAEWTPLVDEVSGATYYYNEQTGQSQWEAPQAAAAHGYGQAAAAQDYGQAAWQPPQRSDPQGSGARDAYQVLWRIDGRRLCSGGRISLRRHDLEVLSRYHMLKQKLTVSRKQAEVACLQDGSATLTSVGWGATPNANPNPNPKPNPHPHPHPHTHTHPKQVASRDECRRLRSMLGEGVSTHVPTRAPTWHQPLRAPSQLRPAVSAPSPVSHRPESGSPFWEAPPARAEVPNLNPNPNPNPNLIRT